MENYDLRDCFLPDLAGLHVRIYQFRELLRQHLPILSAHLEDLQVDPAYVSQWFLSFFAVTCPLPMLFRIYDVVFAEGASETIMRVALSVMQKNQARILACTELENVVQLLLSRSLWGCYNYNADELVEHFVSLSDVVTRERLAALEQGYRESQLSISANLAGPGASLKGADAARALDITTAASRFLGRIWASTSSSPKVGSFTSGALSPSTASSSTLSPGLTAAASRPLSMLRRTVSKQSLASTLNSMEASSVSTLSSAASVLSSASTESTSISRDSSAGDDISSRESAPSIIGRSSKLTAVHNNASNDDKRNLHNQIEDLLTALSELQRNHALLADQLQKEREERSEDKKVVRSLLDGLRNKANAQVSASSVGGSSNGDTIALVDSRKTIGRPTEEQLSSLLDVVEERFDERDSRRSSIPQTKSQLRDDLVRAKEQLSNELSKSQQYNQRIYELEQEVATTADQLKESRGHVRALHQEKQRLEKQVHTLRVRASDTSPTTISENGNWFSQATGIGVAGAAPAAPGGLRELKLGRSKSTPSQSTSPNNRASSVMLQKAASGSRESLVPTPMTAPVSESDALLLELVQAKTAEAIARQEAEEMKQKLETLRKAFGLAPGEVSAVIAHNKNISVSSTAASQASVAASAAIGMFGRLTGSAAAESSGATPAAPSRPALVSAATMPAPAAASGGFWGWRR
jgi:hypothetical protein